MFECTTPNFRNKDLRSKYLGQKHKTNKADLSKFGKTFLHQEDGKLK